MRPVTTNTDRTTTPVHPHCAFSKAIYSNSAANRIPRSSFGKKSLLKCRFGTKNVLNYPIVLYKLRTASIRR